MKGEFLGELEEMVLLSVCLLGEDAYGVTITDELNKQTGRNVHLSAVHTSLYRLEEKGLVCSSLGGATQARGGRRKRLFTVTSLGKRSLQHVRQLRNQFYTRIPALLWET